jgi:hemolysin activation/secretion protein
MRTGFFNAERNTDARCFRQTRHISFRLLLRLIFAACLGLHAASAFPQSPPRSGAHSHQGAEGRARHEADAEEQRRRAQQDDESRQRRQSAPDVRLPTPDSAGTAPEAEPLDQAEESPCFHIERLQIEGPQASRFHWLESELSELSGKSDHADHARRCIGPQAINRIVKRASALIVAKGYITTRLGVPEQDLSSGTLRLALVPGVIRTIRIVGEAPERNWLSAFPVRPGDLLNLRDIEQGVEQMKRIPSQEVSIDIAPAATPGESDLVLTVQQGKPWRLGLSLDDSGFRSTGRLQASVNASLDNPLGLNDILSFSVNNDADQAPGKRGTRGHSLMYSLPWGNWTFSLSDSVSHYLQTIQGINQTFTSSGDAHTQELKLQRLLYRDQAAKSGLQFRLLSRENHSYIEDTEILSQRRRTSAAELGLSHRQYIGTSQLDLLLAHRQGVAWLGGKVDAPGWGSNGSPTFTYRAQTLDASLLTPFSIAAQPLRWISAVRMQTTRDVMYAADYIAIGNRYTVRGFDGNTTLAAERGGYWRNELDVPLANSGSAAYVALDHGWVSGPGAKYLAGRHLSGAVVGLRGSVKGATYDVFIGGPLHKPEDFPVSKPVAGFQLGYSL